MGENIDRAPMDYSRNVDGAPISGVINLEANVAVDKTQKNIIQGKLSLQERRANLHPSQVYPVRGWKKTGN